MEETDMAKDVSVHKEFCVGGSKLKTVLYCRYRTG